VTVFGGFFSSSLFMLFLGQISLLKTVPPTSALVTFLVTCLAFRLNAIAKCQSLNTIRIVARIAIDGNNKDG